MVGARNGPVLRDIIGRSIDLTDTPPFPLSRGGCPSRKF